MSSSGEVAVFTDTSLGTHIALAVSPDITAGDFKRELERAHFNCFPGLGEIRVYGLMVKQKSRFYHLPELVPVKHAFQGFEGNWYLHAEASLVCNFDKLGLSEGMAADFKDHIFNCGHNDHVEAENYRRNMVRKENKKRAKRNHCLKPAVPSLQKYLFLSKKKIRKRSRKSSRKRRIDRKHFIDHTAHETQKGGLYGYEKYAAVTDEEQFGLFWSNYEVVPRQSTQVAAAISGGSSEVSSVTAIINRYFPNFEEVSSFCCPSNSEVMSKKDNTCLQVDAMPEVTAITPPKMLSNQFRQNPPSGRLNDKKKGTEVGKRVVMASNSLGFSASKQGPAAAVSVCKFRDGILLGPHSSSLPRNLVFEISDSEG